jgi:hypothetical protein
MSEQPINAFNQVDQQVANGMPATVLVERTNGDITTGQVMGITEGKTKAFFGDVSEGPRNDMPYKPVPNERLTDEYQAKLAEELAGKALLGSGVELGAEAAQESPVDKYTEAYVREHPYAHLLDKELSEEQADEVAKRIEGMDLRTDDEKRVVAEQAAIDAMRRQREGADHRYNLARQSGADHDAATKSANSAYVKTHQELLAEELRKIGLE